MTKKMDTQMREDALVELNEILRLDGPHALLALLNREQMETLAMVHRKKTGQTKYFVTTVDILVAVENESDAESYVTDTVGELLRTACFENEASEGGLGIRSWQFTKHNTPDMVIPVTLGETVDPDNLYDVNFKTELRRVK